MGHANAVVKEDDRRLALGAEQQAREHRAQRLHLRQQRRHSLVGLDQDDGGHRLRLRIEAVDLLRDAVIEHLEVFFVQVVNKLTRGIDDRNRRGDEGRLDLDLRQLFFGLQILAQVRGLLFLGSGKYGRLARHPVLGPDRARAGHCPGDNGQSDGEDDC